MEDQPGNLPLADQPQQKSDGLVWETSFALLTNPFVLLDMVKLLGITFLIVCGIFMFIGAINGGPDFTDMVRMIPMMAIIIGVLAVIFVFVMLVVYRNRFPAKFTVNSEGAMIEVTPSQRKMNSAVVMIGFLAGKPGVAGSGMLARSQELQMFPWAEVYRVDLYPSRNVVVLRNSWRTTARLYCTPENYEQVASMAVDGVNRTKQERESAEVSDKRFKSQVVQDIFNRWLLLGVISVVLASATPLLDELGIIWSIGAAVLLGILTWRGLRVFFGVLALGLVAMAVVLMVTEATKVTDYGGMIRVTGFESATRDERMMFFVLSVIGLVGLTTCAVRNLLTGLHKRKAS